MSSPLRSRFDDSLLHRLRLLQLASGRVPSLAGDHAQVDAEVRSALQQLEPAECQLVWCYSARPFSLFHWAERYAEHHYSMPAGPATHAMPGSRGEVELRDFRGKRFRLPVQFGILGTGAQAWVLALSSVQALEALVPDEALLDAAA